MKHTAWPARVLICRSNPVAPDPRVEKIARALSRLGYCVSILGWDRTADLPGEELLPAAGSPEMHIPIRRLAIPSEYGHGLANLPNLLRWQFGLLKILIQQRHAYDVIHACDFDTVLPALICKLVWAKKVVYDIFDFYADHLRATPEWIKRAIRWLDIQSINHADALILADEARYAQIEGARPPRSTVIYNSPDEPDEGIPVMAGSAPSLPAGLRIAYVGLLQVERGLFEMMALLQKHPDWSLDLAGFGGDEARLVELAQALPNVTWHGRVPYTRALQLSQAADVLFATYDPAIPNHRYSSPNKVFEAMLLGKPIIVARHTNMDRMIEAAGCGLVIEYGDQAALETALVRLHQEPALRQRLGANGRQADETTYSWPRMVERLAYLYRPFGGEQL